MEYSSYETYMISHEKILVVASHPDDEILGCGGTLAKLQNQGSDIQVLFLSDGESSRFNKSILNSPEVEDLIDKRKECAIGAAEFLKTRIPLFLNYPDNRLDSIPLLEIIKEIEFIVESFKPTTVFTHSDKDLNIDHKIAHNATLTATRPYNSSVKNLLYFEIPSSTHWNFGTSIANFSPNYFVDISNFGNHKMHTLSLYKKEMRAFPHPRSEEAIISLMNWRGSSIGCNLAEAFEIGRIIE